MVEPPLWKILVNGQWEGLSHALGKIKNVPNHQPVIHLGQPVSRSAHPDLDLHAMPSILGSILGSSHALKPATSLSTYCDGDPYCIDIYILLVVLASFCVWGHSYPGSICRNLGTIYRISGYIIYNSNHHHNNIIIIIIMLYIHMAI